MVALVKLFRQALLICLNGTFLSGIPRMFVRFDSDRFFEYWLIGDARPYTRRKTSTPAMEKGAEFPTLSGSGIRLYIDPSPSLAPSCWSLTTNGVRNTLSKDKIRSLRSGLHRVEIFVQGLFIQELISLDPNFILTRPVREAGVLLWRRARVPSWLLALTGWEPRRDTMWRRWTGPDG